MSKIINNGEFIDAILIKETQEAFLLDCEGDEIWFPKSQVNFDEKLNQLEEPLWLLRDKFPGEY